MAQCLPRILFVNHTASLGGGELGLLGLVRDYRMHSRVLLLDDGPFRFVLQMAGADVQVVRSGGGFQGTRRHSGLLRVVAALPGLAGAVRAIVRACAGFDVIYANSQKAFAAAAFAGKIAGKPVIWSLQDLLTPEHFSALLRMGVARLANSGARAVIVNSGATARAFVAAGGAPRLVHVVPSGVDEAPFLEAGGPVDLPATAERPWIGLFGRISPWKGQHVAVEAMEKLERGSLFLAGDALFGEDDYKCALIRRIGERGLSGRIHLLGFRDEVAPLMRQMDVIIHTSIAPEPFGRVIVEAMLAGRPVIATRGGGPEEIVEEGVNGWLVPPGDAGALAAAVDEVLRRPDAAARVAAHARTEALEKYTLSKTNAAIAQVITAVLDPPAKLAPAAKAL
jgi:glycosyltransferase involved in cell wall biosynthesis